MMPITRSAPKPGDVKTPAEFVRLMRRLLDWSGLTLDDVEERARARGALLPGEVLIDPSVLKNTLPSAEALRTFLEMCGYVPEVQSEWLRARDRLVAGTPAGSDGSPNRESAAASSTSPRPIPSIAPDSVSGAGPEPAPGVASDPAYKPRHRKPRRRPSGPVVAALILTTVIIVVLTPSLSSSHGRPAAREPADRTPTAAPPLPARPRTGAPASPGPTPAESKPVKPPLVAPPVDAPASSGPAARWEFDKAAGSTVADSSGHRFTVTLHGRTALTTAPGGTALMVDGAGHATTAGPVIRTNGAFTVTAWVRLDSAAEWGTVVSQHDGRYDAFLLDFDKDAERWAFMTPDDVTGRPVTTVRSIAPPRLGAWTHLAAVYDGAGQLRLYIGGRLEGTARGPRIRRAAGPLDIGQALYEGEATDSLHGAVDEVSVFDHALSGEEIKETVRAGRG
jgi:hypothetical protein